MDFFLPKVIMIIISGPDHSLSLFCTIGHPNFIHRLAFINAY